MLKLRKPFSRKVQLHIRQDLLQKLWDKYVPEASAEYGRIELIYPDVREGQNGGEPRQIQLLVNLVLRNRIVQSGISGSGEALAAGVRKMEKSVRRAEKCFLTQLRCYDVRLYRAVNRYVTLLEKAREEGRRYQSWQRENRIIERQRTEYRLFSAFFSDIKNFLTEHCVETAREIEKELIRVLPEDEYGILAKQIPNLAEPREFMLHYMDVMEVDEIRQLWEQLEERSREIKKQPEERSRETQEQPEERYRETKEQPEERYREAQEQPEERSRGRQEQPEERSRGRQERLEDGSREFIVQTDRDIPQPKRQIEEMNRQQEDTGRMLREKMAELRRQYAQEVAGSFHERFSSILDAEPYQMISAPNGENTDMVFVSEPYQEIADIVNVSGEQQNPAYEIRRIMDSVQLKLEAQKERLRQREAKALETYGELYREVLKEQNSEELSKEGFGEDMRQIVEETFRNRHQGEMSRGELRDICEWGRVFAELFANPILTKQKFNAASSETEESEVSEDYARKEKVGEEWVYLTQEVSRYMEERGMETFLRIWQENVMKSNLKEQGLQKLLWQMHRLSEEQRAEFVKSLSDMIHIWTQVSSFGQFEEPETEKTEIEKKLVWQTVEEAFLSQYQEEMDEGEFRELCRWSRALTEIVTKVCAEGSDFAEADNRQNIFEDGIEDEAEYQEMVYLVEEIHRNMEEKERKIFSQAQREQIIENGLKEEALRNLLEQVHVLDKEKRTEFVRNLSDSIHIWNQLNPFRQQTETEVPKEEMPSGETRIADVSFQKLWEWGEALQDISEHDGGEPALSLSDEASLSDENNLRKLIGQMKYALQREGFPPAEFSARPSRDASLLETDGFRPIKFKMTEQSEETIPAADEESEEGKGDSFRLVYTDKQFQSQPIQSLMRYARELNEEQYESLLRELSQITRIQWRLSQEQGMEGEAEQELRQILVERNRGSFHPEPYLRMWEWGEALLFNPEYAQNGDADSQENLEETSRTVPGQAKNPAHDSESSLDNDGNAKETLPEDKNRKQTQWIRRQIEEAKDRNNLQRLIGQMNHRLAITQKTEQGETKTGETIQLVYADSQLAVWPVQSLLGYIQNLNEEEYGVLVQELAQVIKVQSMLTSGVGLEEETAREARQMFILRKQSKTSSNRVWEWGKALLYYPEQGQGQKEYGTLPEAQRGTAGTPSAFEGRQRTHLIYTDDRNNLQQMIWQLNHMTAAGQPAEKQKENEERHGGDRRKADKPSLIYTPGQLQLPSVQNLLHYLHDLEEEQYEILAEELAKVTRIQQRLSIERDESEPTPESADIIHTQGNTVPHALWADGRSPIEDTQGSAVPHALWAGGQRPIEDIQEPAMMHALWADGRSPIEDTQGFTVPHALWADGISPIEDRTIPDRKSRQDMKNLQDVKRLQAFSPAQHERDLWYQSHRQSYSELARRIRQYEVQRRHTMGKNLRQNLRQIQESYFYSNQSGKRRKDVTGIEDLPDIMNIADMAETADTESPAGSLLTAETEEGNAPMTVMESLERAWYQPEGVWYRQELAYSIQAADSSKEQQQRTELRLQEENRQIKSAQEQLGKKLTEVENQLKAVEGAAKAKEDARTLADQVKRQLYEELHVEKLRRGLI